MSCFSKSFLRWMSTSSFKKFGTVAEAVQLPEEAIQTFRTTENNPINHSTDHLSKFYTVPDQIQNKLFHYGGFPKEFQNQVKTFAETCILIRQPTVEILSYLRQADYSKSVNRYVLYGKPGVGKSLILAHIIHYGYMNNQIIIHIPWVSYWFRYPKEIAPSTTEGIFDLPLHAAAWLLHFKNQNDHLLSTLDLKISKEYVWNQRESMMAGTSILELVNFGINRVKYACQVVTALIDEVKAASTAGKCSTLIAIDGFNAFYYDKTKIIVNHKTIPPSKISLTEAFKNAVKYDWCNGAVVLTLDKLASDPRVESHLPRFLLGKDGFEHLDPFLPVSVENYTNDEFSAVIEYYKNRKWIRDITSTGEKELQLKSVGNPYTLMQYCIPL
ncbi:28S ribosomal protein S29, mitochondrial [Orussus abietinus]|uniref:28S ribosomal protein S29, mitochondrial n=1 Tax=Orussus abietinus TaxID=222816 RepID=UPI000625D890|nr:28S ribosomal protein S29, mitochondrial [Orussus abietinus]